MVASRRHSVAKGPTDAGAIVRALQAGHRIMEAGATTPTAIDYARRGNLEAFIGVLPWEEAAEAYAGAAVAFERIIKRQGHRDKHEMFKALQGASSFDSLDGVSHRFATQQGGELVKNITQAQTATLRTILGEAFEGGLTVDKTASRIRQVIGLHPAWAQAVVNYEARMLANPEPGYSLARWEKVSRERAERYAGRLVRKRSLNIARTEIMTAENLGRLANMTAAVHNGTAGHDSRKEWSPGPGACRECRSISGQIVHWQAPFSNGVTLPPAHPSCRCTVVFLPAASTPGREPRPIDWTDPAQARRDVDMPDLKPLTTDRDDLTMETTQHWDDAKFTKKLQEYGEKGDDAAIDRLLELIDERDLASQWAAERAAVAALEPPKPLAKVKLDENPVTNPAARPERGLSAAEQVSEQFQDLLNTSMSKALDDINGVFYNNKYLTEARERGITQEQLWTAPWQVAQKYASEELKEWWLVNGRETLPSFRYKVLGRAEDKRWAEGVRNRGHEIGQNQRDRSVF